MPKTLVVDAKSLEQKQIRARRLLHRMRRDNLNFDRRLKNLMALGVNFNVGQG